MLTSTCISLHRAQEIKGMPLASLINSLIASCRVLHWITYLNRLTADFGTAQSGFMGQKYLGVLAGLIS